MSTTPPKTPSSPITSLLSSHLSTANDAVAHLQRILSTTSGVDTSLLLLGYGSNFLQAQLAKLLELRLVVLADRVATETAKTASRSLNPGETLIATLSLPASTSRLADVQQGLKTFSGTCSDIRAFMRLWGLLGIWAWGKRLASSGEPQDGLLKVCAYVQLLANGMYLINEHPVYLAGKGILRGPSFTAARIKRGYKSALQWFAVHVTFEFIRLFRTWQLRREKEQKMARQEKEESAEEKKKSQDELRLWWKSFLVYSAYAPLCAHWASETGFLGEGWVGFLGMCAGMVGLREAWRQTA